jgi:hypothetical protein
VDEGDALLLRAVTGQVIGCAFRVANAPSHGFVEKVCEMPLPPGCDRSGSALCGSGESWSFATT